jgi:hypothetical protein
MTSQPFVLPPIVLTLLALAAPSKAAATCESLASLSLPDTSITLAQSVPAGRFTPPATARGPAMPYADLPAFCRVALTVKPTSDSNIRIEVWLPIDGWNGKFNAIGTGGWAGAIGYPQLRDALRRGYATSSTDIAGAPANFWSHMNASMIWIAQAAHKDEASYIPPAKYPLIHQAVIDACDALDGVKDGILEDPTRCKFDPGVLTCKGGDAPTCLTRDPMRPPRRYRERRQASASWRQDDHVHGTADRTHGCFKGSSLPVTITVTSAGVHAVRQRDVTASGPPSGWRHRDTIVGSRRGERERRAAVGFVSTAFRYRSSLRPLSTT